MRLFALSSFSSDSRRCSKQGIIGPRLLPLVLNEWREPHLDEYRPRTGWSLWNCYTDVLGRTKQASQPAAAALTTIRLQKLLAPPHQELAV
jgi:hypothetical protein